VYDVRVEVTPAEFAAAAVELRKQPEQAYYYFTTELTRGKGVQTIKIPVPRDMLLGIADAIAGAVDLEDAGHRYWHWENPEATRPCEQCAETRDKEARKSQKARATFLATWAKKLHTTAGKIEDLLAEYSQLPRPPRGRG
jgi:hypothetical protein